MEDGRMNFTRSSMRARTARRKGFDNLLRAIESGDLSVWQGMAFAPALPVPPWVIMQRLHCMTRTKSGTTWRSLLEGVGQGLKLSMACQY